MRKPAAVPALVASAALMLTACSTTTEGSPARSGGISRPTSGTATSGSTSTGTSGSGIPDPSDPTCSKTVGGHSTPYTVELACAMAIPGVAYHPEPAHEHVLTTTTYDTSPPVGGNHSPIWADCTGKVYPRQIANENAVHMLEHGAVWITYRPGLPAAQLATLTAVVQGQDRLALSPYAGLSSPISLQAWGHQLFVQSASDPRIVRFVTALRGNATNTPEPGATCSDPYFQAAQSYPGHPQVAA